MRIPAYDSPYYCSNSELQGTRGEIGHNWLVACDVSWEDHMDYIEDITWITCNYNLFQCSG